VGNYFVGKRNRRQTTRAVTDEKRIWNVKTISLDQIKIAVAVYV